MFCVSKRDRMDWHVICFYDVDSNIANLAFLEREDQMTNSRIQKINEHSDDYGWGPTEDGNGLVVWKGDWYKIFSADTVIKFVDGIVTKQGDDYCFEYIPIHCDGDIKGDPHFTGAEGGKYDVHGEHGKVYNILSDAGVQVNAQVSNWGTKGATIMSTIAVVTNEHQVSFSREGQLTIDGNTVTGNGKHLDGAVELNGKELKIDTGEYAIALKANDNKNGDYLNISFDSDNVAADGVLPHGLWGQTADGDGVARNGDKGASAQGGGAIEDANGNLTQRGDTQAHKTYEVGSLFDTTFVNHNKFYEQQAGGNDMTVAVDTTTGTPDEATGATFKLIGNSSDFGWDKTEDGEGIVVWKGEWFKILDAGTQLQFDDQLVSTTAPTQTGPMTVEDNVNETQYLVGSEGNDNFVINGNASDFDWDKTEDGEGIVVWGDNSVDLLYDFEQITFNDETVQLDMAG